MVGINSGIFVLSGRYFVVAVYFTVAVRILEYGIAELVFTGSVPRIFLRIGNDIFIRLRNQVGITGPLFPDQELALVDTVAGSCLISVIGISSSISVILLVLKVSIPSI